MCRGFCLKRNGWTLDFKAYNKQNCLLVSLFNTPAIGIRTGSIYSFLVSLLHCFLKYNYTLKAKRDLHSFGCFCFSLPFLHAAVLTSFGFCAGAVLHTDEALANLLLCGLR